MLKKHDNKYQIIDLTYYSHYNENKWCVLKVYKKYRISQRQKIFTNLYRSMNYRASNAAIFISLVSGDFPVQISMALSA